MLSRRTFLILLFLVTVYIGYIELVGRVIFKPSSPLHVIQNDRTTATLRNDISVENTLLLPNRSTWTYTPKLQNDNKVREKEPANFKISKFKPEIFQFYKRIQNANNQSEDLMKAGPFRFLPNYRNPCWETWTKELLIKCLPYFYLLGAPKSGNSPLLENYISIFRNAANDIYTNKDKNDWHSKIVGDCSTSTLWDNDYWTMLPEFDNLTEPLYTNADYIYHLNPKTKLIAILRNPIDRLYSDYLYFGNEKKTPQQFHDIAVENIDYMTQCLNYRSERFCVYHKPNDGQRVRRFRIGMYSVHLKEFLRVFPRSQIYVLYLEEYSKNISMAMKKLFKFLELEPVNATQMISISFKENKNERRTVNEASGDMLPETRELLSEFYHPYNQELSQLLGHSFNYNESD